MHHRGRAITECENLARVDVEGATTGTERDAAIGIGRNIRSRVQCSACEHQLSGSKGAGRSAKRRIIVDLDRAAVYRRNPCIGIACGQYQRAATYLRQRISRTINDVPAQR